MPLTSEEERAAPVGGGGGGGTSSDVSCAPHTTAAPAVLSSVQRCYALLGLGRPPPASLPSAVAEAGSDAAAAAACLRADCELLPHDYAPPSPAAARRLCDAEGDSGLRTLAAYLMSGSDDDPACLLPAAVVVVCSVMAVHRFADALYASLLGLVDCVGSLPHRTATSTAVLAHACGGLAAAAAAAPTLRIGGDHASAAVSEAMLRLLAAGGGARAHGATRTAVAALTRCVRAAAAAPAPVDVLVGTDAATLRGVLRCDAGGDDDDDDDDAGCDTLGTPGRCAVLRLLAEATAAGVAAASTGGAPPAQPSPAVAAAVALLDAECARDPAAAGSADVQAARAALAPPPFAASAAWAALVGAAESGELGRGLEALVAHADVLLGRETPASASGARAATTPAATLASQGEGGGGVDDDAGRGRGEEEEEEEEEEEAAAALRALGILSCALGVSGGAAAAGAAATTPLLLPAAVFSHLIATDGALTGAILEGVLGCGDGDGGGGGGAEEAVHLSEEALADLAEYIGLSGGAAAVPSTLPAVVFLVQRSPAVRLALLRSVLAAPALAADSPVAAASLCAVACAVGAGGRLSAAARRLATDATRPTLGEMVRVCNGGTTPEAGAAAAAAGEEGEEPVPLRARAAQGVVPPALLVTLQAGGCPVLSWLTRAAVGAEGDDGAGGGAASAPPPSPPARAAAAAAAAEKKPAAAAEAKAAEGKCRVPYVVLLQHAGGGGGGAHAGLTLLCRSSGGGGGGGGGAASAAPAAAVAARGKAREGKKQKRRVVDDAAAAAAAAAGTPAAAAHAQQRAQPAAAASGVSTRHAEAVAAGGGGSGADALARQTAAKRRAAAKGEKAKAAPTAPAMTTTTTTTSQKAQPKKAATDQKQCRKAGKAPVPAQTQPRAATLRSPKQTHPHPHPHPRLTQTHPPKRAVGGSYGRMPPQPQRGRRLYATDDATGGGGCGDMRTIVGMEACRLRGRLAAVRQQSQLAAARYDACMSGLVTRLRSDYRAHVAGLCAAWAGDGDDEESSPAPNQQRSHQHQQQHQPPDLPVVPRAACPLAPRPVCCDDSAASAAASVRQQRLPPLACHGGVAAPSGAAAVATRRRCDEGGGGGGGGVRLPQIGGSGGARAEGEAVVASPSPSLLPQAKQVCSAREWVSFMGAMHEAVLDDFIASEKRKLGGLAPQGVGL